MGKGAAKPSPRSARQDVPRLHNVGLEQACLGGLLLDAGQTDAVAAAVEVDDFFLGAHRWILQAILDLRSSGQEATPVAVADELKRRGQLGRLGAGGVTGEAYLTSLLTACDGYSLAPQHARRIHDYARRRRMVSVAAKAVQWAHDLEEPSYLERTRAAIEGLWPETDEAASERTCWEHHELMQMEFAPTRWIVQGLIAQGALAILAGRPKVGKSWMCLQLAQAVTGGSPFLGRDTSRGPVIYYALEDSARRLRGRLEKQHALPDLPITYRTQLAPLGHDGRGEDQILAAIDEKAASLVMVDTLASAIAPDLDQNEAGVMASLTGSLRRLAQRSGAAVVAVLHHNKQAAWRTVEDVIHDVRGSGAIPAAADCILGLYRKRGELEGKLLSASRDAEDITLAVKLDVGVTWAWHSLGDARVVARTNVERETYELLQELGEADAGTLARELGKARSSVHETLQRLRARGLVATKEVPATRGSGKRVLYYSLESQQPIHTQPSLPTQPTEPTQSTQPPAL